MIVTRARLAAAVAAAAVAAAPAALTAQQHLYPAFALPRLAPTIALTARGAGPADQLAVEGRFREAAKLYRKAAAARSAAGEYAREELLGLAAAQFALNDIRGTARTLDELADQAAAFGDPETRLTSLFQAALLHQQLHAKAEVADHVARIRPLLKSPVIPANVRQEISARLEG
jgi:hypothetical protein